MTKFNNIDDIEKYYYFNSKILKNYICYNDIILNIFNSTILDIDKYDLNNYNISLFIGMYFQFKKNNYDKMKYYYLSAVKHNCSDAMYYLSCYYYKENKYEKMKYYCLMAIKHGNVNNIHNLGFYYDYTDKKNYDKMKYYYLMGVKKNHAKSMRCLGQYYRHVEKNYDRMKYYYLISIKNDNNKYIVNSLGCYYETIEKNYDKMKHFYLKGINLNNYVSMRNLFYYYKNNNKTIEFYLILIQLTQNKLISEKIIDLKNCNEIKQFENKINLSIKLNNYKKCILCNNDNVLNIKSNCNIELCIECYQSN